MTKWIARGLLLLAAATFGAYLGKRAESAPSQSVTCLVLDCDSGP